MESHSGPKLGTARSVGQGLTHRSTRAPDPYQTASKDGLMTAFPPITGLLKLIRVNAGSNKI